MNPDTLRRSFPNSLSFPSELERLCAWQEQHGYPISGDFKLEADEMHDVIGNWFGTEEVVDRFGVFGSGPDGSLYAIWRQEDGRCPIVHLGSEGQNNFVLVEDMKQFLRLLAIDYREIGFDDLSAAPKPGGANAAFQQWVANTFDVTIPRTGSEITDKAKQGHEDLQSWIERLLRRVRGESDQA